MYLPEKIYKRLPESEKININIGFYPYYIKFSENPQLTQEHLDNIIEDHFAMYGETTIIIDREATMLMHEYLLKVLSIERMTSEFPEVLL